MLGPLRVVWASAGAVPEGGGQDARPANRVPSMEARERFLSAIPVEVGGAAVFILPLERMEKVD